jgi:hypothetical protein
MRLLAYSRFICLLAITLTVASFVGASPDAEEQCLAEAWKAFASEKYEDAIKHADKCIDDFAKPAEREQEKLSREKEPIPPTGAVNDAEKEKIFKRGVLNDVAAAYFIKGRSAEYLYRKGGPEASAYKEVAKEAYKATCRQCAKKK